MTQEVTILQTQFKTHVVSFWLCYAIWWMFTNPNAYKFQPTNMADNKNDVIFFLGAGTLYSFHIGKHEKGQFCFYAISELLIIKVKIIAIILTAN